MCCEGFLKMIMFVFNGLIFLAGGVILGVGVWVKVDSGSLLGVLEELEDAPAELAQLANVGYLLIAVGSVLIIMGFLGCCGAVRENRCMLLTFFIIVLVIFIAEVAGAVVVLVFEPQVENMLSDLGVQVVKSIQDNYGQPGNESFTELWNTTMKELKCCGYTNYTDFIVLEGASYPQTCCNVTECKFSSVKDSDINGCLDALVKLIKDNAAILGAVALGIAALEIAAMVVSMTLYKNFKS